MSSDNLLVADRSDTFACLGFDADAVGGRAQDLGDAARDGLAMGANLRSLGQHHAVKVFELVAGGGHLLPGQGEHAGRVAIGVLRGRVGEQLADVTQGGGTEQRIGHGMQQDVGVAVADQRAIVGDVDSAHAQRSARLQPVGVMSDSYARRVRGRSPCAVRLAGQGLIDSWQSARDSNRMTATAMTPTGREDYTAVTKTRQRELPAGRAALSLRQYLTGPVTRILWTTMAIIELSKLTKTYQVYQKKEGLLASIGGLFSREYRQVQAVRGIDLKVDEGEFVAFLGPNGAGKTTTLKLLSGVINPTSGTATVMGHVPWRRENAYRRRFALVMGQKNQLWWDLPAQESFRLHQQIYRIDDAEFNRTHDELTDLLDVRRLLGQPVRELSLGERMKMELIAALLHSPQVLFLDEPTIGLDVIAQHNVQEFLKHYQELRKITILLTSHYMKDVAALCQRTVIIAQGQIMYDGSLSGIVDRFSSHKIVTLLFSEDRLPDDLERYGEVLEREAPKAKLRVPRREVAEVMGSILRNHAIEDVTVEELPLEEVIAEMFSLVQKETGETEDNATAESASASTTS